MGIMLALAVTLQFLEGLIPVPLPLGVKAGFSSIVVMYVMLKNNLRSALSIAVIKSSFVFITRGFSAFCMSISGGLLSVIMMWLCMKIMQRKNNNIGLLLFSVTGGLFHNIGQLAAATVIAGSLYTLSYLPILAVAGIISGIFTGTLLKILMTRLHKY